MDRRAPPGAASKPLLSKLGIKRADRVLLLNAPPAYREVLGDLPPGVIVLTRPRRPVDFIQLFSTRISHLKRAFPSAKARLLAAGMLWVSWPKQSSSIESDLNEDAVREIGLSHGLVDVKVIAVDEDWSGLKFVYRLRDRRD